MNGSTVDLEDFRQQVRAFFDAAVTDEFKETSRKSTSIFTPFEPLSPGNRRAKERTPTRHVKWGALLCARLF